MGRTRLLLFGIAHLGCQAAQVNPRDAGRVKDELPPDAAARREDAGRAPDVGQFSLPDVAVSDALEVGAAPPPCPGTATAEPASCAAMGIRVEPHYAGRYTCFDLGPVPGMPPQKYGGLTLTQDKCSTTLLIGGRANEPGGQLFSVTVARNGRGQISGFVGQATPYAEAPYNDGGVTYGPGGVLFITRWPSNQLQQTRPGSRVADRQIMLGGAPLNIASASASLAFVPPSLPGAGALKLVSWSGGEFYTLTINPDGRGTFDVTGATQVARLPGGPEGFTYVSAGSELFPVHSMLVSEWTANKISTYEVDEKGDPKLGTRRDFITGLTGAEGAYRDPATGDFFFSTWSFAPPAGSPGKGDRVIAVRGFQPERVVE
jgi:hypothetical protein